MSVYLVGHIDIHDRDRYADYEAGFLEVFARYDGEFLAVDDGAERLEGEQPFSRCVLIKFPDAAAARRWYDSPEYQALAGIRWEASSASIVMMRGLD